MTAKRSASESHAARVARGRVPVAIVLCPDHVVLLGALATATGQTRSAVVGLALEALARQTK